MRFSLLAVFLFACFQSTLHADLHEESKNGLGKTKFYAEPKDITITYDGIYFECEGSRIPVQSVQSDAAGLFITPKNPDDVKYLRYTCPGCKRSYAWYENCNTPKCPYSTQK